MSVLRVWIPGSLPAERNALADIAQGRAIPRWNRLGKRNLSVKKNLASRAPRARSARKRVMLTTYAVSKRLF